MSPVDVAVWLFVVVLTTVLFSMTPPGEGDQMAARLEKRIDDRRRRHNR